MALLRNIAGVHKLGLASPEMDMQRLLPDENGGGGGGSYYDVDYPEEPEPVDPVKEPVKPVEPMPVDYGGNGNGAMDPSFYQPDGAGDKPGPSDQQPVYPILPIPGYEEVPPAPKEVPNTVKIVPPATARGSADLAALGVLGGIFLMIVSGRPKGAIGGIAYAGALAVLYLRLKNVQTAPQQPANTQ